MKDEKEQWIDDVLNSMKGSRQIQPSADLFNRINEQIHDQGAQIIPMNQWRISIAAAAAILILNIFVLQNQLTVNDLPSENLSLEDVSTYQIISNYKLYD